MIKWLYWKRIKWLENQNKELQEKLGIEVIHVGCLQRDVNRFAQVNKMLIKELKGYVEENEEKKTQEIPTFKQSALLFNDLIFNV